MTTATQSRTIEYVLDAVPHLTLTNHRGDLHVVHDAGPGEVRVTLHSRHSVDMDLVEATADGSSVRIAIPTLSSSTGQGFSLNLGAFSISTPWSGSSVDVDVHVAPDADLALDTRYGDIVVAGRSGTVTLTTGAGEISAESCVSATVTTGAGDARIVRSGPATVRTGSGDISVEECSGRVAIHTGSGDVHLGAVAGELTVNTGAGDVHVRLDEGSADVRTGMGDVTVQVPRNVAVWQELTTATGDARSYIDAMGKPEKGEPYLRVAVRTGAGDVTLSH